ncbi:MAG: type II toxin-antitoxin system ParD family antitoxin [Coleofasciculus sp. C1-SOL-03]|uniref:ribbon-helix-helix domain-containing protein n=1 Tax=Coleofasciculus sp. C1-SOL-03 TaxID=3069522 RepID=UPI0032F5CB5C
MNITLTPEAEQLIQEKLKSGQYQTAYEVIVEALQLLEKRDKHYEAWLEEITRQVEVSFKQLTLDEKTDREVVIARLREQVTSEALDPLVIEKLKGLAQKHQRSLPAELTHIIEAAIQSQRLNQTDTKSIPKTPDELGWSPGFFEKTAGKWQGEPLTRGEQGEYEQRLWELL